MRKLITTLLLSVAVFSTAQTFEDHYTRSLSDVMGDVQKRFGIRLKYDMDTTGLKVTYADFRIRPYSVEETLTNLLSPFDFKPVYQQKNVWKVKRYEYPRRQAADGEKLIPFLSSLYHDRATWEARRDTIRKEVAERLGILPLRQLCLLEKNELGGVRQHDGYTVQNFRLSTINNHTICGSIYAPSTLKWKKSHIAPEHEKGKYPLIICPNGHFSGGRYNADLQKRYATLARMGAVCVSYDLWGWGESEDEVGAEAHHTSEAHVMQAYNGLRILDLMLSHIDIDPQRVGVNGGSGGGTQAVLLSVLDDRFTACCPVVSMSSWFDGGCPCESGKPIQLAGGGTCNAELAATFAPKPMLVVSDGGDWTSTTPTLEFPYLQRIYGFYGATHQVSNIHLPEEKHDFGPNKRQAVYDFFIKVFGLDSSKLDETKVVIEDENTLRYHPKQQ
ncbi:MAG: acetylxylan esterase [Prevotella sp.]|nr:acetylxylan esterase [Prevotella sp.]